MSTTISGSFQTTGPNQTDAEIQQQVLDEVNKQLGVDQQIDDASLITITRQEDADGNVTISYTYSIDEPKATKPGAIKDAWFQLNQESSEDFANMLYEVMEAMAKLAKMLNAIQRKDTFASADYQSDLLHDAADELAKSGDATALQSYIQAGATFAGAAVKTAGAVRVGSATQEVEDVEVGKSGGVAIVGAKTVPLSPEQSQAMLQKYLAASEVFTALGQAIGAIFGKQATDDQVQMKKDEGSASKVGAFVQDATSFKDEAEQLYSDILQHIEKIMDLVHQAALEGNVKSGRA